MRVAVLGPLVVRDPDLRLGSSKERAVLEMLALRAPEPVPTSRLISAVWGDHAPTTAARTLQSLVSRLRQVLPDHSIERVGDGYALARPDVEVDVRRFEQGLLEGRRAMRDGAAAVAVTAFADARSLWRGGPAPDLAAALAEPEVVRLEESYRCMVEDLAEVRLALGDHVALVPELQSAVAEEPLRERRWAQLMVGLHRSGRRAEALRAYQRARTVLVEQLGLEPGPDLVALEHALLADDATLHREVAPARRPPAAAGERAVGRPRWMTSFVGRDEERQTLLERVAGSRLVTVTGPGGVGKSRLVGEVARDLEAMFRDGLWYVDLAPVGEGLAVAPSVAAALGLGADPGRTPRQQLVEADTGLAGVLVLDNCEHLVAPISEVVDGLLGASPQVRVVATSRETLSLPGERVMRLGPLRTPPPGERRFDHLIASDAVRLFVDRASSIEPGFILDAASASTVGSICRHLDGLPLAVELAAARSDVLGPADIEAGLGDRFHRFAAPERAGPERHRTLEHVLDWSYERLSAPDRQALDRLSVFPGSFPLAAMETVVVDDVVARSDIVDVLTRLVRRSLVLTDGIGTERRYRLLETVREYGRQHLGARGELDQWRDRHLDWVLSLVVGTAERWPGNEAECCRLMDATLDDLEEAVAWASGDPGRAERALTPVLSLFSYWGTRRHQGGRWLQSLALGATSMSVAARVEALWNACFLTAGFDLGAGRRLAAAAQHLAGEAPADQRAAALATMAASVCSVFATDPEGARAIRTVAIEVLDGVPGVFARYLQAYSASLDGRHGEARVLMRSAVDAVQASGDEHFFGGLLTEWIDLALMAGADPHTLRDDARLTVEIARRVPCARCECLASTTVLMLQDEPAAASVAEARRAVRLATETGLTLLVLLALADLVVELARSSEMDDAAELAGAIDKLAAVTGYGHLLPARRHRYEQAVRAARSALGADRFERHSHDGAALSYTEVLARAIGRDE